MFEKRAPLLLCFLLAAGLFFVQNGPHRVEAAPLSQAVLPQKSPDRIDSNLRALQQEWLEHTANDSDQLFTPNDANMPVVDEHYVIIDAVATLDTDQLLRQLEAAGMRNGSTFGRMVSGEFPIAALDSLNNELNLKIMRPAYAITSVGSTTSQGDIAMRADLARAAYNIDGSGIIIGTLSDTYDCLGGAAGDVASGDLPSGINVLDNGPCAGSDEGRAMMQLIADSAPGAAQAFHTAFRGQADFASGIIELQAAGADVIVDDVGYFASPFFQDGIIAQAVDQVYGLGAAYFSAAGNSERQSYENTFRPSGTAVLFTGGNAHDFDPGPGVDLFQSVTIPNGAGMSLSLQWDQPFFSVSGAPGSTNDMDIALLDTSNNVVASSTSNNIGGDPVEILSFTNNTGSTSFNIVIEKYEPSGGPDPGLIKYVEFRSSIINEYDTNSSTIIGHPNASHAQAVGAARYSQTPPFGTTPAQIEPFSSGGTTPILFDTAGNSVNTILRDKPEIVAPDGTNTTFFGSDSDGDGFPNFFGTSAAAPHAAAAAALMLEQNSALSPQLIYDILEYTASDMDASGFDFDTGYGFIQVDEAVAQGALVTVPFSNSPATMVQQNAPNNSSNNNSTPTFRWDTMSEATEYQLVVYSVGANQVVHNQMYTRLEAVCAIGGECVATPSLSLSAGAYRWLVRPFNIYGFGPWSVWP